MIRVETAVTVRAPVATVREIYADYSQWPQVFPTIKRVRLVEQRGLTAVLEIDHIEGHVINELTVAGNDIRLWEVTRHYAPGLSCKARYISREPLGCCAPSWGDLCVSRWSAGSSSRSRQPPRPDPRRLHRRFDRCERAAFDSTLSS